MEIFIKVEKLQKRERRIGNKEDGGTLKCIIVKNYRLEQIGLKSYMTYNVSIG